MKNKLLASLFLVIVLAVSSSAFATGTKPVDPNFAAVVEDTVTLTWYDILRNWYRSKFDW